MKKIIRQGLILIVLLLSNVTLASAKAEGDEFLFQTISERMFL